MADAAGGDLRDALYEVLVDYPEPENIGPRTDFETVNSDHPVWQTVVETADPAIEQLIDTGRYATKASVG